MPPLAALTLLGLSLGATLAACTNPPSPAPVANALPPPTDRWDLWRHNGTESR
jgi:hypothetical protein